jgi:class 3 adenylate cyclase
MRAAGISMVQSSTSVAAAAPPEKLERKLVTILAADFVDFSKRMGADEEGTARALAGHRATVDGIILLHGGRIFNTAGDSVLAEFSSPVEAVRGAVEIQDALRTRNEHLPEANRLMLRIGVNLGDVIIRGEDFLGDAVNIAARLESMAEPGGVLISGSVYDQIAGKLDMSFQAKGAPPLKNIDRPIRAFSVSTAAGAAPPLPSKLKAASSRLALAAAAVLLFGALAAGSFWWSGFFKGPNGAATGGHWLNGDWAVILTKGPVINQSFCTDRDQQCRFFSITGVSGDGRFQGNWGFTRGSVSPAEFTISGDDIRILTPSNSIVEGKRGPDGLIRGHMLVPNGSQYVVTSRHLQN